MSDKESDDDGLYDNDNLRNNPTAHLLMAFIILWGFIFHVSNAALNVLILFFSHFLKILSPKLTDTDLCPKSLKAVQKYLKLNTDEFIQYVNVIQFMNYRPVFLNSCMDNSQQNSVHMFSFHIIHLTSIDNHVGLLYFTRYVEAVTCNFNLIRSTHINLSQNL